MSINPGLTLHTLKPIPIHMDITLMLVYLYIYWLVVSTPLKNMKVSWDDYSHILWRHQGHVPNHQPANFNKMCITDYDGLILHNKTLEKNMGLNQNNGFKPINTTISS